MMIFPIRSRLIISNMLNLLTENTDNIYYIDMIKLFIYGGLHA
jgi:hypothetical protein